MSKILANLNGSRGTVTGTLVALAQAIIGLSIAFGLSISAKQEDAIVGVVIAFAAVLPIVGALYDHGNHTAAIALVPTATPVDPTPPVDPTAPVIVPQPAPPVEGPPPVQGG